MRICVDVRRMDALLFVLTAQHGSFTDKKPIVRRNEREI